MGFGPWVKVIRVTLDEDSSFASVRFLPQNFLMQFPKERHRACSSGG
jgi:hypothetical protein